MHLLPWFRPALAVPALLLAATLAGCGGAPAERSPSLQERRLGVIQGTSDSVDLLPARSASAPAARLADRLSPPTGRPLSASKKTDSPDHGITLPTAASGAK